MTTESAMATLDERIGLLQAALEQAGTSVRTQSVMIGELQGELRQRNNQLADWQQRCQSLGERLSENWPPPADAAEMDRLRAWVVELEARLDAEATESAKLRRAVEEWRLKYQNSVSAPGSGLAATQPTSTADPDA